MISLILFGFTCCTLGFFSFILCEWLHEYRRVRTPTPKPRHLSLVKKEDIK